MFVLSQALLGCLLAVTSVASPTPRAGKGAWTAHQTISKKSPPGAIARANALVKYGGTLPAELVKAVALYDGTGVATPETYDIEYLTPVTVGSTVLNLDFDTGSSDLWVYSSLQSSSQRSGHSYYTPGSTATKLSGYTWSISYGDGSTAKGSVYTDYVAVGATNVSKQAVEAATSVSSSFLSDVDSDGLLGLGFDALNTVSPVAQKTFISNAISEGLLDASLFTADLKAGAPGSYDFGYIDTSKYTGSITYTAVTKSPGYWTFTSSGYAIGSNTFVSSSITGIADTGTTLMYLPTSVVSAYWKTVTGATNSNTYGGWVFPCSTTLPSFTVGIGSYHAVVPGSYLNYAPVTDGSSTCYGGLQPNTGIGLTIYGDVFLKSQFIVFDVGNSRLGVAAKTL